MKKYLIFKESLGSILSSNSNFGYYSCGSFVKDIEKAFDFETKINANIRLKELKKKYANEFVKFKVISL